MTGTQQNAGSFEMDPGLFVELVKFQDIASPTAAVMHESHNIHFYDPLAPSNTNHSNQSSIHVATYNV